MSFVWLKLSKHVFVNKLNSFSLTDLLTFALYDWNQSILDACLLCLQQTFVFAWSFRQGWFFCLLIFKSQVLVVLLGYYKP